MEVYIVLLNACVLLSPVSFEGLCLVIWTRDTGGPRIQGSLSVPITASRDKVAGHRGAGSS